MTWIILALIAVAALIWMQRRRKAEQALFKPAPAVEEKPKGPQGFGRRTHTPSLKIDATSTYGGARAAERMRRPGESHGMDRPDTDAGNTPDSEASPGGESSPDGDSR